MLVDEQTELLMLILYILIRKDVLWCTDMNVFAPNMQMKVLIILLLMRHSGSPEHQILIERSQEERHV